MRSFPLDGGYDQLLVVPSRDVRESQSGARTGIQPGATMRSRTILVAILIFWAGKRAGHAQESASPPTVLASYTFEGNADDVTGVSPSMTLSNAPFVGGTLFLNGIDGLSNPTGYLALAPVPQLSYDSFTFRLEFKPESPSDPIV